MYKRITDNKEHANTQTKDYYIERLKIQALSLMKSIEEYENNERSFEDFEHEVFKKLGIITQQFLPELSNHEQHLKQIA